MNSLKEIGQVLSGAKTVLLFPHINADGDALGSCVALAVALRRKNIKCSILIEDKIADNLMFLDSGYTTFDCNIFGDEPDVCVAVDNGEPDRFPKRRDIFYCGKIKICLDHHPTSKPFADYNCIEPKAAAAGEIIYDLLTAMDTEIDKEIATALFTAITTDSGNFQYSNTTRRTFEIAMNLMDSDFDLVGTSNAIYQNNPPEKIKLETAILSTMQVFADGKAALACVTQDILKQTGARMEDTSGIINTLRGIRGVEVAIILKENEKNVIKASMRAKSYADVSAVCQRYEGGGHVRAAGCTFNMSIEEAVEIVKKEITAAV